MRELKTNTAVIVTVGPFYDKTDGVTIEGALTITNERITLTADTDAGSAPTLILDNIAGATSGTANDLNYITNNDAGLMQLELAAADVNRLGRMTLTITDAANHVPVFHEFEVVSAAYYDWKYGTTIPPVNTTQIAGAAVSTTTAQIGVNVVQISTDATAADNAEAFFDGTGYAGTNNVIPLVTTTSTATAVTTVNGLAANVITAAATAADFGAEVADAVLNRDMSTGTDSGSTTVRTPRQALRALRNKVDIVAGTLTVTKEDDSTASWTAAVTTAAGDPIASVDPAGP